MSRLIDADALIKTLGIAEDCKDCPYQSFNFCGRDNDFVVACEAITDAPTIDAVEVVWCKDCKHHKDAPKTTDVWCERVDGLLPKDWFCADGERKEDDSD